MAVRQNALLLAEVPMSECQFNTQLMLAAVNGGK